MQDSKNILFIVFGFSFLGGICIYNVLENHVLWIIVLSFLIILFLNFYIFAKKYFVRIIFSVIGLTIWLFIAYLTLLSTQQKLSLLENSFW